MLDATPLRRAIRRADGPKGAARADRSGAASM
jgi:hypothetical protein